MKRKLSLLVMLILALSIIFALPASADTPPVDGFYYDEYYEEWNFYRDGVMVTEEIIEYSGSLYAFNESGRMYEDGFFWLEQGDDQYFYRAKPGGALYVNEWYWYDWDQCWYYFGEGGKAPRREFKKVGGTTYFFGDNGYMMADGAVCDWESGKWYAFDKNGGYEQLDTTTTGWKSCRGNWYYIEGDDWGSKWPIANTIKKISGTNYLFNDKYALAKNELLELYDYENGTWDYYYATAAGTPYTGWVKPYANETFPGSEHRRDYWYYFGADGKAYKGYRTVNGTDYYFYENGVMSTNDWDIVYGDNSYAWTTDKNGVATYTYNGWLKVHDSWRYFDGSHWLEGLQKINGTYYYFNGYDMLDDASLYNGYRAKAGGKLYQNEWYRDGDIWFYYDENCQMLTDTVIDIYGNGVYYAFDDDGWMITEQIVWGESGKAYLIDKNGAGKLVEGTGWYAIGDDWLYAVDGQLVSDCWMTIGGSDYYFDGYRIAKNTYAYDYRIGEYCVLSAGGAKITTVGWHVVGGEYYYVKGTNGALATDWYKVNGTWYYFWPEMAHNTVIEEYETGNVYGFNTNGTYFQVTGDGFYTSYPGSTMYVKNNKLVTNAWEKINGYWYYFDEGGYKQEGPSNVDGTLYLFDAEGRLVYNNWATVDGGRYRSDAAGKLLTGYQKIDGKYYLFDDKYGHLLSGGVQYQDGYDYILYNDGTVYSYTFTNNTWYKADGYWYYYADGYFVTDDIRKIDGQTYAFNSSGRMITDSYYREYYFNASGHMLTNTWYNTQYGYRYFDGDGDYYYWGYHTIGGSEYYFEYGYLKTGLFVDDEWPSNLVSTNTAGVVVSKTPMSNGWTYADGVYHYVKDDNYYYTGWVGAYYVEDGEMAYNRIINDKGNYYFIDTNGVYIKSGWYNLGDSRYSSYIYANSNGVLKRNEWAQIGGTWYYFDVDARMVYNATYYIDGEYHKFAQSGAWLGKVNVDGHNGYKDGWVYANGGYYYSYNGKFLTGAQLIDGKWYRFGHDYDYYGESFDPKMLSDEYYGGNYYTASGALFEGTGWHVINGYYVYFDENSCAVSGLIEVNGAKYYMTGKYINENTANEKYIRYMVSNSYVWYNDELYYAAGSGALSKVTKPNGWYWIENWKAYAYYNNGVLVENGERVIGGVTYFFYDGYMVSDDIFGYTYYDASGKKVTGTGWYWSENYNGWIYVNNGKVYTQGLYYIGGVAYYFLNGVWVQ